MSCVEHCPEEKAIGFSFFPGQKKVGSFTIAVIIGLLFTGGIVTAKMTGHWQNKIPKRAYLSYVVQTSFPWNSRKEVDPETMEKMMMVMKNIQMQRAKTVRPEMKQN